MMQKLVWAALAASLVLPVACSSDDARPKPAGSAGSGKGGNASGGEGSDEPNGGALAPSGITRERFGTVPRHYIRCTQDCAIPLDAQDHMIASVDASIGSKTLTHTLESSHSPFLSQPANLAKILIDIASA